MMSSPWSLPLRAILFVAWFAVQFVVTSLRVSALILTPRRQPRPAIVRFEVEELSDAEITLLLTLITITPDTLVISIDRGERVMFVHGMFVADDPDTFRSGLRETHDRMLRAVRVRPPAATSSKEPA